MRILPLLMLMTFTTQAHALSVNCIHKESRGATQVFSLDWKSETSFIAVYTGPVKTLEIASAEHSLHCEAGKLTNGAILDCRGGNPKYPVFARIDQLPGDKKLQLAMQTIHGSTLVSYQPGECKIAK